MVRNPGGELLLHRGPGTDVRDQRCPRGQRVERDAGRRRRTRLRRRRKPALLALDRTGGRIWLYPGDGKGGFGARILLATDAGAADTIVSAGAWTGLVPDVITRENGRLFLRQGNGAGRSARPARSGPAGVRLPPSSGRATRRGTATPTSRSSGTTAGSPSTRATAEAGSCLPGASAPCPPEAWRPDTAAAGAAHATPAAARRRVSRQTGDDPSRCRSSSGWRSRSPSSGRGTGARRRRWRRGQESVAVPVPHDGEQPHGAPPCADLCAVEPVPRTAVQVETSGTVAGEEVRPPVRVPVPAADHDGHRLPPRAHALACREPAVALAPVPPQDARRVDGEEVSVAVAVEVPGATTVRAPPSPNRRGRAARTPRRPWSGSAT